MAQLGQAVQVSVIVLFGGIEIGMGKLPPVAIPEVREISWIFLAPSLQALFLNIRRRVSHVVAWNGARLKVVGKRQNQVYGAILPVSSQPLPVVRGQALRRVFELAPVLIAPRIGLFAVHRKMSFQRS